MTFVLVLISCNVVHPFWVFFFGTIPGDEYLDFQLTLENDSDLILKLYVFSTCL
jgi:hypothetical protein